MIFRYSAFGLLSGFLFLLNDLYAAPLSGKGFTEHALRTVSWSAVQSSTASVCAYRFRKRIVFDPDRVEGSDDLFDFPALISIPGDNDLRTTGNGGDLSNANGYDIAFTAEDGVTLLSFEIESYSATSGQLVAWVKIPVLSTSQRTVIYLYYGMSGVTANPSSNTVWSSYAGVWHLNNNSFLDSSPTPYNGTNNGSSNLAAAQIAGGRSYDGNDWIEVNSSFPNKTTNFTISGWVLTTDRTVPGQRIFCDDVNNTGGYALSIGDGGSGMLRFFARGSNNIILDSPANAISNNVWTYCVGVADISGNVRRIYINGVLQGTITSVGWNVDAGNASIGGETAAGETANRLRGQVDEVRVANTALTAEWIRTEYNNQSSPGTFYSISAEPKAWTGGSSTNWSTSGNWSPSGVPTASMDIVVNAGTFNPSLNTNIQLSALWVKPGAVLTLSNTRTLSVTYDVLNCGTITGAGSGALQLNAGSRHIDNQWLSGGGAYNLPNLIINNTYSSSPAVRLHQDVNVSGALVLTSGIMYTSAGGIIALGNTATSNAGSATSFVSGPFQKSGSADFVFPIGKLNRWRRAGIRDLSASGVFRAEYFNSAPSGTTLSLPLHNVSGVEYWQIDRVSGGNAKIALYWENAGTSFINNCADLTVARHNGTTWVEHAATTDAGSSCAGAGTGAVATNARVTAFSPFTFGSKLGHVNLLPVTLASMEAKCIGGKVRVNWSTASEHKNDFFVLERSSDAFNWLTVTVERGAGSTLAGNDYSATDAVGMSGTVYYRLRQVDDDGTEAISGIVAVDCSVHSNEMLEIRPNPSEGDVDVTWHLISPGEKGNLQVIDNMGRICHEEAIDLSEAGSRRLTLAVDPGVYYLRFTATGYQVPAKKLLISESR